MTSIMQDPFYRTKCEHCQEGYMMEPENGQEWHLECNECQAILLCYSPLPHQADFHKDPAKFVMYAGGYGSGKQQRPVQSSLG